MYFCKLVPAESVNRVGLWVLEPKQVRYVNGKENTVLPLSCEATMTYCADKGRLFVLMRNQTIAKIWYGKGIEVNYNIYSNASCFSMHCWNENLYLVGKDNDIVVVSLNPGFSSKMFQFFSKSWKGKPALSPKQSMVVATAVDPCDGCVFAITLDGKLVKRMPQDSQFTCVVPGFMTLIWELPARDIGKVRMFVDGGVVVVLVSTYNAPDVLVYSEPGCVRRIERWRNEKVIVRACSFRNNVINLITTDKDGNDSVMRIYLSEDKDEIKPIKCQLVLGYVPVDDYFLSWDNSTVRVHGIGLFERLVAKAREVSKIPLEHFDDFDQLLTGLCDHLRQRGIIVYSWRDIDPDAPVKFHEKHLSIQWKPSTAEELTRTFRETTETFLLAAAVHSLLLEDPGTDINAAEFDMFKYARKFDDLSFHFWHMTRVFMLFDSEPGHPMDFYLHSPQFYSDSLHPRTHLTSAQLIPIARREQRLSRLIQTRDRCEQCQLYLTKLLENTDELDDDFRAILKENLTPE